MFAVYPSRWRVEILAVLIACAVLTLPAVGKAASASAHDADQDSLAAYGVAQRLMDAGRAVEVQTMLSRLKGPRKYAYQAQILMGQGDYEGALQAFDRYIDSLPAKEQAFYRDISTVATPQEAADYRTTPPGHRKEFLRRFWLHHDPLKASGGLMRWAEHDRRVFYARTHFGKAKFPWDRRGEVYIRYGAPDYQSTSREINTRVPQNVRMLQTELARLLYGPDAVSYTFVGPVYPVRTDRFINVIPEDNPDLADLPRMPQEESMQGRAGIAPEDTLGFYGYKPVTLRLAGMTVPWEVWIYTRVGGGIEIAFTDEIGAGNYDYAPIPTLTRDDRERLTAEGPTRVLRVQELFSDYAPAMVMRRVTRETPEFYDLSGYEPLDFSFDAVDSRGQDKNTDVRVFMGIPVKNLVSANNTALVRRRVALINRETDKVYRAYGDVAIPLSGERNAAVVEEVPMRVPPGDYTLAVQVWDKGTKRMGAYHLHLPVESYSGQGLMLSDIEVAQSIAPADSSQGAPFVRSAFRVMPSPGRIFYQGHPVFLYFEVYNLSRNDFGQTHYEVAYTVRDASQGTLLVRALSGLGHLLSPGDGGAPVVTVRYEQTGHGDQNGDYVELDLGHAAPGEYDVHVTVRDLNSGSETAKDVRFHVVEDKRLASRP